MTDRAPTFRTGGGEPPPAGDAVQLWRIALDDPAWSVGSLMRDLAQDEIRRAGAFHFDRDRRRFVVGRAVLRRILAGRSGLRPSELRFAYGDQGKPRLVTPPGNAETRFNLSHSRGVAICGVTRGREIGVDVERVRQGVEIERIARRFFSARENRSFRSILPDRRREAFFRCWTRKEAYLKATGRGVFGGSTRFDVTLSPDEPARLIEVHDDPVEASRWRLQDLSPAPGYVGAVVTAGDAEATRLREFEAH